MLAGNKIDALNEEIFALVTVARDAEAVANCEPLELKRIIDAPEQHSLSSTTTNEPLNVCPGTAEELENPLDEAIPGGFQSG